VQTADECPQLFGGYGYMQEYPISRMFIDSRAQKIYRGANEIAVDRTLVVSGACYCEATGVYEIAG